MNVLMFSPSYDFAGGAVIAANRLFTGLNKINIRTKMLVGQNSFENDRVKILRHNFTGEKILYQFTSSLGLNYIHYYSSFKISKHDFFKEANILNFHSIHSGYFNYLALPKLTRLKPAVFTLHDSWSFTGHCGFSYDCEKWKKGCGKCPYPDAFPPIKRDGTAIEWKLKNRVYKHANLTIVTPSMWLLNLAKQSMLQRFNILHIPNGLNTDEFIPLDNSRCKKILGISPDKKVLLFGAMGLSDSRKGGDLLIKALNKIPDSLKKSIVLLTFGHTNESFKKSIHIPIIHAGYVRDDKIKITLFSAADLFLFPTRADNLPCIIQESLACGTPVVSFDVGGVPELVRPGLTGLLAKPEDSDDFLQKTIELLEDTNKREQMKKNCREIALSEYNLDLQSKRYADLFLSLQNSVRL